MRIAEPTPEQLQEWKDWVASRPECVRKIAERFEPWSLYRLKSTGQRVTLRSFYEDGTVSVFVLGKFNFLIHERCVFGIDPDDLEPCDLPDPSEVVGSIIPSPEAENED